MVEQPNQILTVRGIAKAELMHIIETADTDGYDPGMKFLTATRVEVTDPAAALEAIADSLAIRTDNIAYAKHSPSTDPWLSRERKRRDALRSARYQIRAAQKLRDG